MIDRKKVIYVVLSIMSLIFPIGLLTNIIDVKMAMPSIFIAIGMQFLYYGFFILPQKEKFQKILLIIFGVFFNLLSLFIFIPIYYF